MLVSRGCAEVTLLECSRLQANKAIIHKLSYRYLMLVSLFFIAFSLGNEIQRCMVIITDWLMSRKSIRVSWVDIKSQSFFFICAFS